MTDPLADFRGALQDRYNIEGEIGRGGMATVYRAHDLRHDRFVALKLLHPELAASLGPERFQREIKLAARLQHPHILTVLDSGEAAGRLWFSMPFVEGETLRARLQREGQLPLPDALRIARETADALDYAHRHDVVHRDIKPENILLSDGHALVADFGIARTLGAASSITEPGMAVGTPAYMSPEQATGAAEVGSRTDTYSLGVVLYEMLAGEAPFSGPSAQAVIARALTETPRPLKVVRATVPASVQTLVAKAMARSPADRFGSTAEMGKALDDALATVRSGEQRTQPSLAQARVAPPRRIPMALVLGLGVLIGGGVLFAWRQSHGTAMAASATGPRRLAVLPFENLGSAEDGYFADGVTDEVRGKLAALPGMQVTARSSSSEYRKSGKSPAEIGRDLGVDYLLTGTVRWEKGSAGSRVRVSPELIEVATGASKWQQPFDAALTDVFQVQGDIAARVAQALDLALGAGERQKLTEKPTKNLAAYDAFLKGENANGVMVSTDPPALRAGLAYYEQAVALDSAFALAWTRISRSYSMLYFNSVSDPRSAQASLRALERAKALAPGTADVYHAEGAYQTLVGHDDRAALASFEAARALAPENVYLLSDIGLSYQTLGDWNKAMQSFADATRLDPRSVDAARRYGRALLWAREYDQARIAVDRGTALAPSELGIIMNAVMLPVALGDLPGARDRLREVPASVPATELAAYFGNVWDLYWLLDDDQQSLLLRLPVSLFDNSAAVRASVFAQTYFLRKDLARARAYADTSVSEYLKVLKANPEDAQSIAFVGLLQAIRGHKPEAIEYAQRAVALVPDSTDAFSGPYYEHLRARTLTIVGEHAAAIEAYRGLLARPYFLSKAWLKIDPNTEPLRTLPAFQALVNGTP